MGGGRSWKGGRGRGERGKETCCKVLPLPTADDNDDDMSVCVCLCVCVSESARELAEEKKSTPLTDSPSGHC